MKYIIRTEYDCIIKNQFNENFLDKNTELSFDTPEILLIYPTDSKRLIPFILDPSSDNDDNYVSFLYEETKIFYLIKNIRIENIYIENFKYNNENYSFKLSVDKVSFISPKSEKTIYLEDNFKDYSYRICDKLLLLHLIGQNELLLCYNLENEKIKKLSGDKIEQIENQILISKEINNYLNQKTFESYLIKDNDIKQTTKSIKNGQYDCCYDEKLVGYIFLEAIKNDDYDFAQSLLSDNLRENISERHLKDYFGKISRFIHLKKQDFAVFNGLNPTIFSFKIVNKKIEEISNY